MGAIAISYQATAATVLHVCMHGGSMKGFPQGVEG
jgi:hypothetical protein